MEKPTRACNGRLGRNQAGTGRPLASPLAPNLPVPLRQVPFLPTLLSLSLGFLVFFRLNHREARLPSAYLACGYQTPESDARACPLTCLPTNRLPTALSTALSTACPSLVSQCAPPAYGPRWLGPSGPFDGVNNSLQQAGIPP